MESNTVKTIDLNYLSSMVKGNKEFVKEIISIFLSENPKEIKNLEGGIKENDFDKIKSVAHKLKSTLPFIGLDKSIGKDVLEIESLAANKTDIEGIEERFEKVKAACEQAYTELRTLDF